MHTATTASHRQRWRQQKREGGRSGVSTRRRANHYNEGFIAVSIVVIALPSFLTVTDVKALSSAAMPVIHVPLSLHELFETSSSSIIYIWSLPARIFIIHSSSFLLTTQPTIVYIDSSRRFNSLIFVHCSLSHSISVDLSTIHHNPPIQLPSINEKTTAIRPYRHFFRVCHVKTLWVDKSPNHMLLNSFLNPFGDE